MFFSRNQWLTLIVSLSLWISILFMFGFDKSRPKRKNIVPNAAAKCTGTCVYRAIADPNADNGISFVFVSGTCAQVIGCGCNEINFVPAAQMHAGDIFYGSCTTGNLTTQNGCNDSFCRWIWDDDKNDWVYIDGECAAPCSCAKPNIGGTYTPYGTNLVISINYYVNLNGDVVARPQRMMVTVFCTKPQLQ
jgi:hypothetical protein